MLFEEALRLMREGKKVRCTEPGWGSSYISIEDNKILYGGDLIAVSTISNSYIMCDSWEVIDEQVRFYSLNVGDKFRLYNDGPIFIKIALIEPDEQLRLNCMSMTKQTCFEVDTNEMVYPVE